ncbi:MAG: alpha/beta hydrolase [Pseudomonadales bacterium]|nr:alpha/beta hydrolase [Pseudomonadales bacterium]RLU02488.1 MAG: alpha/beta hydrolase [Ketobacter sp.]
MYQAITLIISSAILCFPMSILATPLPSEAVNLWQAEGKYFEFNHHRIFYRDSQDSALQDAFSESGKPTLVMLHGFPTSSWDWHKLWESLGDDYRLIALDFLGFGFSDKPNINYSISSQADLVEQLLARLKVEQAHLIVHDYGTYVSQELLARQQTSSRQNKKGFQIQSLTMLNGVVSPQDLKLRPIQKALNSPFGWIVSRFVSANRFGKNFSAVFGERSQPGETVLQDYWYLISLNNGHRLSHKLIHYYDESLKHSTRWVEALQHTDVPLMLVTGLADPVAGQPMVDKFESLMPNQTTHVLPDIGHYPHLEDHQTVAKFYRAFIRR